MDFSQSEKRAGNDEFIYVSAGNSMYMNSFNNILITA